MMINLPEDIALAVFIASALAWLLVHIAFAFAVGYDASRMRGDRRPVLVGTWTWFFTVLLGGPLFAGMYWAMHHSMASPFVYKACSLHEELLRQNERH